MSRTISPFAGKPYGVDAACLVRNVGKRTFCRHRREAVEAGSLRRRRQGRLAGENLHARLCTTATEFPDMILHNLPNSPVAV